MRNGEDTVPYYGNMRKEVLMEIVYLAGKITGDPGYREKFKKAADQLREMGKFVLDPTTLEEGRQREYYGEQCVNLINMSDSVYFLPDWEDSEGAKLEMAYAKYCGKKVRVIVAMG